MSFGEGLLSSLPIVGQGLSEYFASKTAKQNTDKTIAANKELAQYQYSKDLEMWNRGNAYNAPAAQMSRLKDAGLNPNLVYGSGVTGNTSANLPKYQVPRVDYNYRPVNLTGMLSFYQDTMLKQAQYDNLKAQRDAIESQSAVRWQENKFLSDTMGDRVFYEKGKATEMDWRNRYWNFRKSRDEQMFPYQMEYLKGTTDVQRRVMDNMDQQIRLNRQKADWYMWDTLGNLGGKVGNMLRAILKK